MMSCWGLAILLLIGVASGNVVVLNTSNRTVLTIAALEADFGPAFNRNSKLRGFMTVAKPEDACTPIAGPPQDHVSYNLPWLVLIGRNMGCHFDLKVLNAQKAGYKGAVVHNVPGEDDIFRMQGGSLSKNITIPSQFIGFMDSEKLLGYIDTKYTYIVEINGRQPPIPDPYFYIIPFFVVVCIIVIILVVALIVKLCREYFHSRRSRLSKRNLKKLPTKKFVENGDPYETCAVCLDDFENGDKIRILPCNHAYHCQCIDPWLLKRKRCCPVCKRKIHFGRRRRDTPTAAPDSSDSDVPASGGDERTPLLGATAAPLPGPSSGPTTSTAGVINAGIDEDYSTDDNAEIRNEDSHGSTDNDRPPRFSLLYSLIRRFSRRRRAYDEDGPAVAAVGPALYGSFDPAPRYPGVTSSATGGAVGSPDHVVEVHTPPQNASTVSALEPESQASAVQPGPSAEIV